MNAPFVGSKNIPKGGTRLFEFMFAKVCESEVQANTGTRGACASSAVAYSPEASAVLAMLGDALGIVPGA